MSFEARLRRGFERATNKASAPVDVALTSVVATYQAQRRQRAVLLVAAAIAAAVTAMAGGDAFRWVQSLDRETSPAQRDDADLDVRRDVSVSDDAEPDGAARQMEPRSTPRGRGGVVVPPVAEGGARPPRGTVTDETRPADVGEERPAPKERRRPSKNRPDLSRVVSRQWSHAPDGNSGVAAFASTANESAIRVRLEITGGGGASELEADVYEIVDGEESHVANFCSFETYSPPFEITPGARIEVRVSSSGCNGTDLNIKGTATVAFYE